MGRVLIGVVAVAIIACIIGYFEYNNYQGKIHSRDQAVAQLRGNVAKLQDQNAQLKIELNKVQSEENTLAAQNNMLMKEIQHAQATGQMPRLRLPYPPK
ncbi:MAG: hypothetical protein ACREQE_01165 [Candidatus Binataceae bacterium]